MLDQQVFTPITMDFFVDGMTIPCDIYEVTGPFLVINKGCKLTAEIKDRLTQHHTRGNGLLVLKEDYPTMLENKSKKELQSKETKKEKLEKETGFFEIKADMLSLLEEVEETNAIHSEKIIDVSEEISHRLEITSQDTIISLVNMLATVDEYLCRHSTNVSMLNGLIGKWLGLSREDVDSLITAGLTHDCGKALVPLQVLNFPRPLSRAEFEVIKMHPIHSYNLLTEFPDTIRFAARAHHEKLNGKGYPDALGKDKLTLMARITAVSDIYDALVSRRVYKEPRSPFQIMVILKDIAKTDLDPFIVNTFTKHMSKELIGKPVLMSNGETGTVKNIDPDDLEFPYVKVNGVIIKTSSDLSCSSMEV